MCGLGHGDVIRNNGPQPQPLHQPLQQPPPYESPAKDASSWLVAAAKMWVFNVTQRKQGKDQQGALLHHTATAATVGQKK